jgi:hypothetical protein
VLNWADFTEPPAEPTRMLGQIPREIAIRSAHSAIQVTGPPRGSEWDRGRTRDGRGLSCAPHNHPEAHRVPRYCGTGLTQRLSLGDARVPSKTSGVVSSLPLQLYRLHTRQRALRDQRRCGMVGWSRPRRLSEKSRSRAPHRRQLIPRELRCRVGWRRRPPWANRVHCASSTSASVVR